MILKEPKDGKLMANRIAARMAQLRRAGAKSLSVVLMLGAPDFQSSLELCGIAAEQGVDIVELGIPTADPFLDSGTMRASMQRALAGCGNPQRYFEAIGEVRAKHPELPLEVMVYSDTVAAMGLKPFCRGLAEAGADAVLVADIARQSDAYRAALDKALRPHAIYPLRFVPDPLRPEQVDDLRRHAQGLVVVQTRADPQGQRPEVSEANKGTLDALRAAGIGLPLVLAYGIRSPQDIRRCIALGADGVLIGTVVLDAAHSQPRARFAAMLGELRRAAAGL